MQGAALPIAMLFLFLITLGGISMLDTSIDNQQMTNNYYHRALSYQAADSLLFAIIDATPAEVSPGHTAGFVDDFSADFTNVPGQPDIGVILEMQLLREENNVKIPGFELGGSAYLFEAEATGRVGNASVTNRMGVALFRPAAR